ncbi:molybdopterin molybdotransferase MoeA [Tissierella sp.]|uniref:molybdopterin molybdotransferase MoeA n=1 Tax=Tissierella sp. TaxID=41274 RepID=UPI002857CB67|nr:molybdopterin molybdotransferase MoeA [Tissierella sp.]MDR7855350.1 molybdopterin molybdotransferase MoeA [Tissierella sp.]
MEFFKVVSVDEGKSLLMDNFKDYEFQTEKINILESVGRVLAEDIYSDINVPEFNRSTVDGYAIKVSDSHGATDSIPSILTIVGEVLMGQEAKISIKSGEAVYVPTGGMIPQGADGVIMIENTEKMDDNTILIYKSISQDENIIHKGEDIEKNALALKKGRKITPEVVGVLAALGISSFNIYRKPRFYNISTGDEIIGIDEELTMGKVRDINSYALSALIEKLGGEVVGNTIIKDDYHVLRAEVEKALEVSDIVMISGGSSVGTRDYTHQVINSFNGKGVFVHGVSIKPGKPTIMGEGKGKLIFGLPGHPVSSIIVFKTFLEFFINKKLGIDTISPRINAIVDSNFPSSPGRTTYQMVSLGERDGRFYATPSFGKSGMISLLSESQGYIIIEIHEEGVYKGEEREVYLF